MLWKEKVNEHEKVYLKKNKKEKNVSFIIIRTLKMKKNLKIYIIFNIIGCSY
jgi:hypothetical protein